MTQSNFIIKKINIYALDIPLNIIYNLSFGKVSSYETLLIEIVNQFNVSSYGETTFLFGYNNETLETGFRLAQTICPELIDKNMSDAVGMLDKFYENNPFLVTGFVTALENFETEYSENLIEVPIIGLLNSADRKEIEKSVEILLSNNYDTIKIKIGLNSIENDIDRIKFIHDISEGKLKIRADANQSLNYQNAKKLVERIDRLNVELLEQPFAENDWQLHQQLQKISDIPIMLDESIKTIEDVKKTIQLQAAKYVKVKLQKCGSINNCKKIIKYAKNNGLSVVIGNGVQTYINCFLEGKIHNQLKLKSPAENIGFLKIQEPLVDNDFFIYKNTAKFMDSKINLNYSTLKKHTVENMIYC